MSRSEIGSLSLKLMGIFCMVQSFPLFQQAYFLYGSYRFFGESDNSPTFVMIGALVPIGLLIALGVILFAFSNQLSDRFMTSHPTNSDDSTTRSYSLQAIAFSLLGVFFVAKAIPSITQLSINYSYLGTSDSPYVTEKMLNSAWAKGAKLAIQLIIGIALFFGSNGLSRLWLKLQTTRPLKRPNKAL
jgi:hypothetical protein